MNPAVKWAATLPHVFELTLHGTADLLYWQNRLQSEGLEPTALDGRAQIVITAADSRYLGIPFRELSFLVLVSGARLGLSPTGAFMLGAFNSRRSFAFCERTFFQAPYQFGKVEIAREPLRVRLTHDGKTAFQLQRSAPRAFGDSQATSSSAGGWEGPVFLPLRKHTKQPKHRWFFAELRGETQAFPFQSGEDSIVVSAESASDPLQSLTDSGFVPTEWEIRDDARHRKSITYSAHVVKQ